MAMITEPKEGRRGFEWKLWFSVAAGPVIWSLHLVLSYTIVALFCSWGFLRFSMFGVSAVRVILILITALAALVVFYAGFLAYGNWREVREDGQAETELEERIEGRYQFMFLAGILLSGIFGMAILLSAFPAIFVRACP